MYGWLHGWAVSRLTPGELAMRLSPRFEIFRPEGPGPFPAVLQFHGCGGLLDNQRAWARVFQREGWVGVVTDSHGPRGLDSSDVCNGRALLGGERAGDVLVSLATVRDLPFVDSRRIVLAGWSHGPWSIMELLAMNPPDELPHNLSEAPAGGLSGLAGLIFMYPYCGIGTRSEPWPLEVPSLFLMAGADSVAPPGDCLDLAAELRGEGQRVDVESLKGVDHAFDERVHGPESDLVYDPQATQRAYREVVEFLDTLPRNGTDAVAR